MAQGKEFQAWDTLMAVLVEAISVVARAEAILARYWGGWEAFKKDVPNQGLCADGELARVGFMTPADVEAWVRHLERQGLVYMREGKAADAVVVDQLRGPTTPCDWIEFSHVDWPAPGQRVAAARLVGSESTQIVTPDGWTCEGSISAISRKLTLDTTTTLTQGAWETG